MVSVTVANQWKCSRGGSIRLPLFGPRRRLRGRLAAPRIASIENIVPTELQESPEWYLVIVARVMLHNLRAFHILHMTVFEEHWSRLSRAVLEPSQVHGFISCIVTKNISRFLVR